MPKLKITIEMQVAEEIDDEYVQAAIGQELIRKLSNLVHESAPDSLPDASVTWAFK